MPERSLESLVDTLHRAAADRDADVTDSELLRRFARAHDPAAFELIVWRHGAMVQAVCRRILGRSTEVDDASQATFIVLLRQAHRIRCNSSLAGWLHGVAYRVAQGSRRSMMTRRRHEGNAGRLESMLPPEQDQSDVGPILHAEIDRLPERLRKPVVLCLVEGRTNEEAARMLKVPHGTVLSRLSRARERLQRRLVRRGITLGAAGIGTLAAMDPVSAALVECVMQSARKIIAGAAIVAPAVVLAHGVIQTMFWNRTKLMAASVVSASILCGAGVATVWRLRSLSKETSKVEHSEFNRFSPDSSFRADQIKVGDREEAKNPRDNEPIHLIFKRRGKITISRQTTYATVPLDDLGYVNYDAALDERLRQGVTPENNAAVLIAKAIGPHPEGEKKALDAEFFKRLSIGPLTEKGDYFIDYQRYLEQHQTNKRASKREEVEKLLERASEQLWTADEFPSLSEWVRSNEKPLTLVVEASKRSGYYQPIVTAKGNHPHSILAALRPEIQAVRDLTNGLCARALLRAGEGLVDEAWQDLLACHRLGLLIARGPTLIDTLVGLSVYSRACKADLALLECRQLDAGRIQRYLSDLQNSWSKVEIADKVNLGERFTFLAECELVDYAGIDYLEGLTATGELGQPSAEVARMREKIMDGLDWDPALRNANRWYDRFVAALRRQDRGEREKQPTKLSEDLDKLKDKLIASRGVGEFLVGDSQERGEALGDIMIRLLIVNLSKPQIAADRTEQEHRNLQIAFALAAYRRNNGQYPAAIGALVPKYVAEVPNDLFTGKPLVYRASDNGYLLYSLGPNQKDDEGRGRHDMPEGDDIGIRMPLPKLIDN
jgi:RNA polymerase sigma factor (sigma-70 family)